MLKNLIKMTERNLVMRAHGTGVIRTVPVRTLLQQFMTKCFFYRVPVYHKTKNLLFNQESNTIST